jgi:hypothetical protein
MLLPASFVFSSIFVFIFRNDKFFSNHGAHDAGFLYRLFFGVVALCSLLLLLWRHRHLSRSLRSIRNITGGVATTILS